jgi:hypothetical protein
MPDILFQTHIIILNLRSHVYFSNVTDWRVWTKVHLMWAPSFEMWCRTVWYKFTDYFQEHIASFFSACCFFSSSSFFFGSVSDAVAQVMQCRMVGWSINWKGLVKKNQPWPNLSIVPPSACRIEATTKNLSRDTQRPSWHSNLAPLGHKSKASSPLQQPISFAACPLDLLFNTEDDSSTVLWNTGTLISGYTVSHATRWCSP